MKVAALDLGSNTFLCLIAEMGSDQIVRPIEDLAEVVRLGQGVSANKRFSEEALERSKLCLARFSETIKAHKVDVVLGVATAAARNAINKSDLLSIASHLDIPVQIISGEQEAELTFKGATDGSTANGNAAVVDIGGGSTEIIIGDSQGIKFKRSFNIGVVQLREKYIERFPIGGDCLSQIEAEIKSTFASFRPESSLMLSQCIAVAGTPTTLAAAILGGFDVEKVDGFEITHAELKVWKKKFLELNPEQIESIYKVPKGRSDVLGVGLLILQNALEVLAVSKLRVSIRGIRYGLASSLLRGGILQ